MLFVDNVSSGFTAGRENRAMDYYKFLKAGLDSYEGDFDKFIMYAPDFYSLLCKLTEENIDKEDKTKIYSALAYFIIPNDTIPEDLYGPAGFIDDIFVSASVLKGLSTKYGIEFLKKYWDQDEDLEKVITLCLDKSKEILRKKNLLEATIKLASLD